MHRETLISLLEQVQPALSSRALQPVMGHYWFTGKNLMAYNGDIALSVQCPTDFKGAVSPLILPLLKLHKAKEIVFEPGTEVLVAKAGKSRIKLPMMGADIFTETFSMPKMKAQDLDIDPAKFMRKVTALCMSLGEDTSRSDYMGITFIKGKDGRFDLFATDLATLSHTDMKVGDVEWDDRFILSKHFVRQLVKIGMGATAVKLDISDNSSMFINNGVKLWGRLEEIDRPLDWYAIMDNNFSKREKKKAIDIPDRLAAVLDRACIITDGQLDKTRTKITVKDAKMKFDSVSDRGEMHDVLDAGDCDEVEASIDPRRVRDGVGRFEQWVITSRVVAMMAPQDNITYVVTAST